MIENAASAAVRAYHNRTKHRFEAYAAGPAALDWDAQPAPFRKFRAAPEVVLPLATAVDASLQSRLQRPWRGRSLHGAADWSLESIGVLLNLSLAISAWKSYGPDRWPLRVNPSSGNLHPVEAYLVVAGIAGLADGVYHYRPEDHALERRRAFATPSTKPLLCVGLTSIMWREVWKYGERAFRYCQLDVGHAVSALAYAAAALGWETIERCDLATVTLAHLLGSDRDADFPVGRRGDSEREEAEVLLQFSAGGSFTGLPTEALTAAGHWQGSASTVDPAPSFRWPIVEEIAVATRRGGGTALTPRQSPTPTSPAAGDDASTPPLGDVILGRRSAQRFDPRVSMRAVDFFTLLSATLPAGGAPWPPSRDEPRISLVLFAHRIVDLEPGIYLLPRKPEHLAALAGRFAPEPVTAAPRTLPLYRLASLDPQELRRIARAVHCHQDIAANACFALGMVAEFAPTIEADAAAYRDLFREAGAIGQTLYLEAEALGLRGTGIGCYFDDPFHDLLGLRGDAFQSVYHFTVGAALDDDRLETSPPYPNR